MMRLVPLVAVFGMILVLASAPLSSRLDGALSRAAYVLFDGRSIDVVPRRERRLRAAGLGVPYREFVSKTYLYVFGAAAAGAVGGVYLGAAALTLAHRFGIETAGPSLGAVVGGTALLGDRLAAFDLLVFAVLVAVSAAAGIASAAAAHAWRWQLVSVRADARRRQIDAGMARTVAFVYALSRGGMSFPDVMRALSRNGNVFGEAATEVGTGVRNIDVFNVDLITAIEDLSQRTPSAQFESFTENLASVLQSGRDLSAFLEEEYERYRETAEEQQEEILELLATAAEVYVTVVVAGMLFLITILLIIGLTAGDTLLAVQVLTYVILPAINLLFLAYLSGLTQPLRATEGSVGSFDGESVSRRIATRTDGGGYSRPSSPTNHERLAAHERLRRIRSYLAAPVESVIDRPVRVLYVAVPITVAVTLLRLPEAVVDGGIDVRLLDDLLIQATLLVLASFAAVYELNRRRLKRLESELPDFLERLASLNGAGIAIVSSFDRVRRSDVGALNEEANRIWRDIRWGASVDEAIARFQSRVRTPSVTRVVTLLRNAMHASNDIGPVLRIAAEQARADRRLERQRKQEMFTYLVVIYVAFMVFLVVILALDQVLIPSLPESGAVANGDSGPSPGFIEFDPSDTAAYRLVFFHAAMLQATLSGLVGGTMGGGSIKAGAKHATIMLGFTYALLVLL